ncbi:hypothetical protein T36_1687 [Helicobacter cinaedi]|nr:hypothetical protein T36_1687 [Helicobacter cinaedi]
MATYFDSKSITDSMTQSNLPLLWHFKIRI